MLFKRHEPKGIDFGIDLLQKDLFSELVKLSWRDYDSYDRAYRNKKGSDVFPEVYIGKGNYRDVLFNNKETVTSFFLTEDKRTYDFERFMWSQGISIIFQANLDKLYKDVKHRADEEMINTILKAIKKSFWDNRMTEIITGFEKVYETLKLSYNNKELDDMGCNCIVRFNFKMIYSNTENAIFIK